MLQLILGQQPYPKSHCSAVGLLTCIHFSVLCKVLNVFPIILFNFRCSYLKDDDVGYFAVHTMAGKKTAYCDNDI